MWLRSLRSSTSLLCLQKNAGSEGQNSGANALFLLSPCVPLSETEHPLSATHPPPPHTHTHVEVRKTRAKQERRFSSGTAGQP